MRSKPILFFIFRFILIFGLLTAPWPGAKSAYACYLRALGQVAFGGDGGRRVVRFTSNDDHRWRGNIDTLIDVANRGWLNGNGNDHAVELSLDARQVGWAPTAFLIALTLATPLPWRRRAWALFWGVLCIHGFILFSLWLFIWNESTRLELLNLAPFWKNIASAVEFIVLTPAGPNFVVAALIWILVTFRYDDLIKQAKAPLPSPVV